MNRILVTGGAEFLGANLCEFLVRDTNNYVYDMDNLLTGRKENLFVCQQHKTFNLSMLM